MPAQRCMSSPHSGCAQHPTRPRLLAFLPASQETCTRVRTRRRLILSKSIISTSSYATRPCLPPHRKRTWSTASRATEKATHLTPSFKIHHQHYVTRPCPAAQETYREHARAATRASEQARRAMDKAVKEEKRQSADSKSYRHIMKVGRGAAGTRAGGTPAGEGGGEAWRVGHGRVNKEELLPASSPVLRRWWPVGRESGRARGAMRRGRVPTSVPTHGLPPTDRSLLAHMRSHLFVPLYEDSRHGPAALGLAPVSPITTTRRTTLWRAIRRWRQNTRRSRSSRRTSCDRSHVTHITSHHSSRV
jgi:hypothetical protein